MHQGFVEETTPADAEAVFATNFFGVTRLTNAVLPGMRRRRHGRIINVGSLVAWVGEPGEGYYAASKAALARYTEALCHEVWHRGIKVSLVEPGAFTTTTTTIQAAATAAPTIADYDGPCEHARETLHRGLRGGGDPNTVACLILKIAQARHPRRRYGAGQEALWLPRLTVLLPQRFFVSLLRHSFTVPK